MRLHLPDLLALKADPSDPASAESVTSINVALQESGRCRRIRPRRRRARCRRSSRGRRALPDERTSTFVVLERFHLAIAIVTVIGSAVFLLALMVMLVDERRGTVGMLRLIGFTRRRILIQVLAEGALIARRRRRVRHALRAGVRRARSTASSSGATTRRWSSCGSRRQVVWQSLAMAVPLGIAASLIASWTLLRQPLLALVRR